MVVSMEMFTVFCKGSSVMLSDLNKYSGLLNLRFLG
jgi:hypothetical protein